MGSARKTSKPRGKPAKVDTAKATSVKGGKTPTPGGPVPIPYPTTR